MLYQFIIYFLSDLPNGTATTNEIQINLKIENLIHINFVPLNRQHDSMNFVNGLWFKSGDVSFLFLNFTTSLDTQRIIYDKSIMGCVPFLTLLVRLTYTTMTDFSYFMFTNCFTIIILSASGKSLVFYKWNMYCFEQWNK